MKTKEKTETTAPEWNPALIFFHHMLSASQDYMCGLSRYSNEFLIPYVLSTGYFRQQEMGKLTTTTPLGNILDYQKLAELNWSLFNRGFFAGLKTISDYNQHETENLLTAITNTLSNQEGEKLPDFVERQARIMDMVANGYPQAIAEIEPEFGFHFDRDGHKLVAETDRFLLYRISPIDKKIKIKKDGKPIIILPPYVLGANILGFLPFENRSYAHSYANLGVPTYIRILKDVTQTPALQTMTGEDDAKDTRYFCEILKKSHGKSVTLNGYCQGGFSALCNLLSGELDGLVDAFITCVAPMDGTRSRGLAKFLNDLPKRFNDLAYGTKTLPNKNQVADGKLMGWVYKIKSIESESPIPAFYRDLMMLSRMDDRKVKISKTAAALNYWLLNERNDLPMEITRMSFASYNSPITSEGTLPIKLFGRELNIKRLKDKKIPWLICYGEHDDLVEKETALAPMDYIDVEVSPFPKGHVAIATSWSDPKSACALHTRFGEGQWRGPVRFHLDMDGIQKVSRKKKPTRKMERK